MGYETDVLTFSQAGEDLVIRNFFYERLRKGDKGSFVDIGAYHPWKDSNTFYLYRAGWRGINIDARPGSMKAFNAFRPEDINLEIGVSDKEGWLTYYDFEKNPGLNTMSKEYIAKLGTEAGISSKSEVMVKTLAQIFEDYIDAERKIDFMNIDIEGSEVAALRSNNWKLFRPSLLACEIYGFTLSEIMATEVSKLLADVGFELYARVNLAMPNVNTVFFVDSTFSEK